MLGCRCVSMLIQHSLTSLASSSSDSGGQFVLHSLSCVAPTSLLCSVRAAIVFPRKIADHKVLIQDMVTFLMYMLHAM